MTVISAAVDGNEFYEEEDDDRRLAEVEFVTSAYSPEEAWCSEEDNNSNSNNNNNSRIRNTWYIHRRLNLTIPTNNDDNNNVMAPICLTLTLLPSYPVTSALKIDGTVEAVSNNNSGRTCGGTTTSSSSSTANDSLQLQKIVYNVLPQLVTSCRQLAEENIGEETVFILLDHAQNWIQTEWPVQYQRQQQQQQQQTISTNNNVSTGTTTSPTSSLNHHHKPLLQIILGRRLIFSHHIISKIKRRDIHDLIKYHKLTGYMKIGWPGILLIEGTEEDCINFYDTIRPWQWQYLVVRGEQQETIVLSSSSQQQQQQQQQQRMTPLTPSPHGGKVPSSSSSPHDILDQYRKFATFEEVEDMSQVAQHCREVGLEALFQTCMKNYKETEVEEGETTNSTSLSSSSSSFWYGALVRVDHMNHGKAYRKWLRKTSQETDCYLLIKEYCPSTRTTTITDSSKQNDDDRKEESIKNNNNNNTPIRDTMTINNNHDKKQIRKKRTSSTIVVGIRAKNSKNVSNFLKRWRTSRVDLDSTGKPCLERQMYILVEGALTLSSSIVTPTTHIGTDHNNNHDINSHNSSHRNNTVLVAAAMEDEVRVSSIEELLAAVASVGGEAWYQAIKQDQL